jgi:hypothetical protein
MIKLNLYKFRLGKKSKHFLVRPENSQAGGWLNHYLRRADQHCEEGSASNYQPPKLSHSVKVWNLETQDKR